MEIVTNLVNVIVNGGPQAIIALLVVAITLLIIDRKRLVEDIERKETKIDKIIDDYYRGNLTLTETLNSLKLVLIEIRSKL